LFDGGLEFDRVIAKNLWPASWNNSPQAERKAAGRLAIGFAQSKPHLAKAAVFSENPNHCRPQSRIWETYHHLQG
jgi:hypothetical protein